MELFFEELLVPLLVPPDSSEESSESISESLGGPSSNNPSEGSAVELKLPEVTVNAVEAERDGYGTGAIGVGAA